VRAGPTDPLSQRPRVCDARPDSFGNQVPLELPDGAYDVKQQLAGRRSRINSLRKADEIYAQRAQVFQRAYQVF
jgi:hypothetical protein